MSRAPACLGGPLRLLATLLLAAVLASADVPAWYKCGCKVDDTRCICPSLEPPRRLTRDQTPQFILLTHDGAINPNSSAAMLAVTRSRKQPNGCPIPATMFAYSFDLDCARLLELYNEGYEVASNGASNRSLFNMTKLQLHNELAGNRATLAKCGIPERDVVGHRSPFLRTRAAVREMLQKEGFLYDSSVIELGGSATKAASLSYGMGRRVWPFTLDYGLPVNCAALAPKQFCNNVERYAGLFEVPVWDLNALGGSFTQDPGDPAPGSVNTTARPVDILVANFEAAYNGNRAPFPLYITTPWLRTGQHLRGLQLFAEYALKKPNVHFVTMRQLLAWMANPIPADQLTSDNLGCGNPGGAGPTPTQALSRPKPPAAPPLVRRPPSPALLATLPPSPQLAPPPSSPASPPPASPPPPAVSPPPPLPPPPSPSPVAAGPAMPKSGVRITFSFSGLSNASFWEQVAAPLRLLVLHDIVSVPEATFIASAEPVPAGTLTGPTALMRTLPATRRALRQAAVAGPGAADGKVAAAAGAATAAGKTPATATGAGTAPQGGTWLEAIMIAGGSDPLQMYWTAQASLTVQGLSAVLGKTGGQLAMPPIVVPFQDGRDLAVLQPSPSTQPVALPPSPKAAIAAPAPAPAAGAAAVGVGSSSTSGASSSSPSSSSSSSSSSPVGVIVGSAAGAAVVLVAVASLIYWRAVVRPRRRAALAALADCSSAPKDWPDGSESALAGSDAGPDGQDGLLEFCADLPAEPEQPPAPAPAVSADPEPTAVAAVAAQSAAAVAAAAATAAEEEQPGSPAQGVLGHPPSPATPERVPPAAALLPASPVLPADQPATPPSPPAVVVGIPVLLPLAQQPASSAAISAAVEVAAEAAGSEVPAAAAAAAAVPVQQQREQPAAPQPAAGEPLPQAAAGEPQPPAIATQQHQELPPPLLQQPQEPELPPQAPLPLPPMAAPAKPKAPRYFQPPAPRGSYSAGGHVVGLSTADAVYATPAGYRRAAVDQERMLQAPLQAERSPSGGFIVAPTVVGPFTPGTYSRAGSLPRGPGSAYSGRSYAGSFTAHGPERSLSGSQHYAASTASGGSSRGGSRRHPATAAAAVGSSAGSVPRSPAGSVVPPRSPSVSSNGPRRAKSSRSSTLASPASPRSEASGSQRSD